MLVRAMNELPMRITVRAPGAPEPITFDLDADAALLLGREPDATRLPPGLLPVEAKVIARALEGVTVSGNHCLVWRIGERVVVCDLRSRNGTSLPLPALSPVSMHAPTDGALTIEVAPSRTVATTSPSRPRDAEWSDAEAFPHAVAREVAAWLRRSETPVEVRAERRGRARDDELEVPFTAAWSLAFVHSAETVNPAWASTLERVVEYAHTQAARLRDEKRVEHGEGFILASPAFRESHRRVSEASARALQTVLLGETGTGKSTLARCYHAHGDRSRGPFEAVNCAEVDKHFARTRLFGAKKGAYTGCHADIEGAVECARGGTLFLDEVAELALDVQGELLTFLDDQRYKRLGDDQWRQADVRLVCGTHGDLRKHVREGRFRSDLWYRIAGRIIDVPPLRERPEDIVATLRARTLDERVDALSVYDALSPEARRHVVQGYPWPGNFRELEAFVRRLPSATAPASIDLDAALAALREGALDPSNLTRARRPDDASAWGAVTARADRVWELKYGPAGPARAQEFREYVEEVMKPLFFARALGLEDLGAVPERPATSYEEMGRRMGCDASTVKNQLGRYLELKRLLDAAKT
jgi:DNA-binding NtrC family response regulator